MLASDCVDKRDETADHRVRAAPHASVAMSIPLFLEFYIDETVSADERRVEIAAEATVRGDDYKPVDDGAVIEWSVEGPGGSLEHVQTATESGFSANALSTSAKAGAAYRVIAKLVQASVDGNPVSWASAPEASAVVVVTPGAAKSIELEADKDRMPADGASTAKLAATARDVAGNLVADRTFVIWGYTGSGSLLDEVDETTNGRVSAVLRAGDYAETQTVGVSIGGARATAEVKSLPLTIQVEIEGRAMTLGSDETRIVTATVTAADGRPAADGAPISWLTRKGTIIGEAILTGGKGSARAVLRAAGGSQVSGIGTVKAFVGARGGSKRYLCFLAETAIAARSFHPVLAGDRAPGWFRPRGERRVSVEQMSDTPASYSTLTKTKIDLTGPPNALIQIEMGDLNTEAELLTVNGQRDALTVTLDDQGRGVLRVQSTGKLEAGKAAAIPITATIDPSWLRRTNQLPAEPTTTTINIALAPAPFIESVQNFVVHLGWGVDTDDGDSVEAIANDLILGAIPAPGVLTDIYGMSKALLKSWPCDEKPNWSAFGLAIFTMVGLLTMPKAD